jgi:hypothetical protein
MIYSRMFTKQKLGQRGVAIAYPIGVCCSLHHQRTPKRIEFENTVKTVFAVFRYGVFSTAADGCRPLLFPRPTNGPVFGSLQTPFRYSGLSTQEYSAIVTFRMLRAA